MFSPWNLRCLSVRVWAYSPDERTSCWPGPGRCAACGTWHSKCWTRPCTSAAARPWWWWCRPWNVTIYNTDHLSDQHTTAIKNQCLYKRGNNSGRQRMSFVSEWVSHPSLASSEVTSGLQQYKDLISELSQPGWCWAQAGPRHRTLGHRSHWHWRDQAMLAAAVQGGGAGSRQGDSRVGRVVTWSQTSIVKVWELAGRRVGSSEHTGPGCWPSSAALVWDWKHKLLETLRWAAAAVWGPGTIA